MSLRASRKKAGIGLNEAAAHFGITKQAVNAWERGETKPNIDTLRDMSKYYGVSADELLAPDVPPNTA